MMFTNVFRIGGLQTVSWFQLNLDDSSISRKSLENEDAVTKELLAAHIQLQNEGRLSSWTFTLPSPQSKGQKIKLWLFVAGTGRPNIDPGLKVFKSGLWSCPGNSSEVTAALCQALRNRFERALSAFAYVRFGSMFVKCKRYTSDDTDFRRTLPSCEVTFCASEEGIFVHLRVRRRRMRPLAASDVRAVLTQHLTSSSKTQDNPAVVVAPYGLTGWLTGCFPGDLVRQLSQSKLETKECSIRNSFPQATVRNAGFMSRSWYVEIQMKFLLASRPFPTTSNRQRQWIEKAFIFPSEAVLVPTVPPVAARTYLKRCWLRKLAGTDWLEDALSLKGFSPLTSLPGYRLQAMGKSNTIWKLNSNSSKSTTSSGSGGSSIKSSDSRGSSGSESDVNDDGEYREDADSAATMAARHGTRISSNAQASDVDSKRTGKRGRDNANDAHGNLRGVRRSPEIVSSAANNTTFESSSVPGSKSVPSQAGTPWGWNENLQSDADIFAEFGDFGDFFEGDGLVFGEPPGTAESQVPFDGDGSQTPGTQYMDTLDPMRMPILDFPMLESLGQDEEEQDPGMVVDAKCDGDGSSSAIIPGGPSLVAKAEAYIFSTEYAPVEMRGVQQKLDKETSYRPEARRVASVAQSGYSYGPNPPPTPKLDSYERKPESRWTDEERRSSGLPYIDLDHPTEVRKGDGQLQSSSPSSQSHERHAAILATDLECALFQVQLHSVKGIAFCAHPEEPKKLADSSHKECVSEITDSSDAGDSLLKRQPDKKKVPERIAGDADEISHDGPRPVEVGVWRPVGLPKQQKSVESVTSLETGSNELSDAAVQELVELLPLVVQQAACSNDITLNGDDGEGPLAWLALHQKLSRQTSMESVSDLCDPSVTEVSPATVASVLQSDMRQAMGVAFNDIHVSGPLSLAEWCRGKAKFDSTDIYAGTSDSKDLVSSITGEPITPPQSSKVVSLQDLDNHVPDFRRSNREAEDVAQKRMSTEDEVASYAMLPIPTIMLGYQEDWLKTAPKSLRYWEKAPFEPYGYPKPVTYYVVCLALDSLLFSALEFFQQLSSVYEACKLGTHIPANVTAHSAGKRALPGFATVELPSKLKGSFSSWSMANSYISTLESGWDVSEFRKSLRRVCKSLPLSHSTALDDYENSPSTVIYVVSPTAEPSMVLQTLMESCQGLGPNLSIRRNKEDGKQSVTGFSIGRLALQIVTAETVVRMNSSPAASMDVLKEVAFAVYNKLRRIPYKSSHGDDAQLSALSAKSRIQAGLWKDCPGSSGLSVLGRDSLLWSSSRLLETSPSGQSTQPVRFLYEPLYVLADNCLLDHSLGQLSRGRPDESSVIQNTFGMTESVSEGESAQPPTFHCCYSWSRNWQWLISVWTDSRGKMLDVKVFPAPRCVSDKEAYPRELLQLFGQIMQQGQQLRVPGSKVQNVVITRIGEFFDTEYQEWQRMLMINGADEPRNWSTVIRPDGSDNLKTGQPRNMSGFVGLPSSPGASSSFASRGLLTGFSKPEQSIFSMKVNQGLQWVQNVTLATITDEDSLQVLSLSDISVSGTWSSANTGGLATGFGMAKTIASLNGAYLFVPAHGLRVLPPAECQASRNEMPAFGQWIQSRGLVYPVSSGYVVSGPTTAMRAEAAQTSTEEEWPCTLHIGLIAHFGCSTKTVSGRQEASMRLGGNGLCEPGKVGVGGVSEARVVLERLGAEYYGLSWLTISPMYLHRRLALPFHCDVAERLDKLMSYVESEIAGQQRQQQQQKLG